VNDYPGVIADRNPVQVVVIVDDHRRARGEFDERVKAEGELARDEVEIVA
jgi:hypothetical protein